MNVDMEPAPLNISPARSAQKERQNHLLAELRNKQTSIRSHVKDGSSSTHTSGLLNKLALVTPKRLMRTSSASASNRSYGGLNSPVKKDDISLMRTLKRSNSDNHLDEDDTIQTGESWGDNNRVPPPISSSGSDRFMKFLQNTGFDGSPSRLDDLRDSYKPKPKLQDKLQEMFATLPKTPVLPQMNISMNLSAPALFQNSMQNWGEKSRSRGRNRDHLLTTRNSDPVVVDGSSDSFNAFFEANFGAADTTTTTTSAPTEDSATNLNDSFTARSARTKSMALQRRKERRQKKKMPSSDTASSNDQNRVATKSSTRSRSPTRTRSRSPAPQRTNTRLSRALQRTKSMEEDPKAGRHGDRDAALSQSDLERRFQSRKSGDRDAGMSQSDSRFQRGDGDREGRFQRRKSGDPGMSQSESHVQRRDSDREGRFQRRKSGDRDAGMSQSETQWQVRRARSRDQDPFVGQGDRVIGRFRTKSRERDPAMSQSDRQLRYQRRKSGDHSPFQRRKSGDHSPNRPVNMMELYASEGSKLAEDAARPPAVNKRHASEGALPKRPKTKREGRISSSKTRRKMQSESSRSESARLRSSNNSKSTSVEYGAEGLHPVPESKADSKKRPARTRMARERAKLKSPARRKKGTDLGDLPSLSTIPDQAKQKAKLQSDQETQEPAVKNDISPFATPMDTDPKVEKAASNKYVLAKDEPEPGQLEFDKKADELTTKGKLAAMGDPAPLGSHQQAEDPAMSEDTVVTDDEPAQGKIVEVSNGAAMESEPATNKDDIAPAEDQRAPTLESDPKVENPETRRELSQTEETPAPLDSDPQIGEPEKKKNILLAENDLAPLESVPLAVNSTTNKEDTAPTEEEPAPAKEDEIEEPIQVDPAPAINTGAPRVSNIARDQNRSSREIIPPKPSEDAAGSNDAREKSKSRSSSRLDIFPKTSEDIEVSNETREKSKSRSGSGRVGSYPKPSKGIEGSYDTKEKSKSRSSSSSSSRAAASPMAAEGDEESNSAENGNPKTPSHKRNAFDVKIVVDTARSPQTDSRGYTVVARGVVPTLSGLSTDTDPAEDGEALIYAQQRRHSVTLPGVSRASASRIRTSRRLPADTATHRKSYPVQREHEIKELYLPALSIRNEESRDKAAEGDVHEIKEFYLPTIDIESGDEDDDRQENDIVASQLPTTDMSNGEAGDSKADPDEKETKEPDVPGQDNEMDFRSAAISNSKDEFFDIDVCPDGTKTQGTQLLVANESTGDSDVKESVQHEVDEPAMNINVRSDDSLGKEAGGHLTEVGELPPPPAIEGHDDESSGKDAVDEELEGNGSVGLEEADHINDDSFNIFEETVTPFITNLHDDVVATKEPSEELPDADAHPEIEEANNIDEESINIFDVVSPVETGVEDSQADEVAFEESQKGHLASSADIEEADHIDDDESVGPFEDLLGGCVEARAKAMERAELGSSGRGRSKSTRHRSSKMNDSSRIHERKKRSKSRGDKHHSNRKLGSSSRQHSSTKLGSSRRAHSSRDLGDSSRLHTGSSRDLGSSRRQHSNRGTGSRKHEKDSVEHQKRSKSLSRREMKERQARRSKSRSKKGSGQKPKKQRSASMSHNNVEKPKKRRSASMSHSAMNLDKSTSNIEVGSRRLKSKARKTKSRQSSKHVADSRRHHLAGSKSQSEIIDNGTETKQSEDGRTAHKSYRLRDSWDGHPEQRMRKHKSERNTPNRLHQSESALRYSEDVSGRMDGSRRSGDKPPRQRRATGHPDTIKLSPSEDIFKRSKSSSKRKIKQNKSESTRSMRDESAKSTRDESDPDHKIPESGSDALHSESERQKKGQPTGEYDRPKRTSEAHARSKSPKRVESKRKHKSERGLHKSSG